MHQTTLIVQVYVLMYVCESSTLTPLLDELPELLKKVETIRQSIEQAKEVLKTRKRTDSELNDEFSISNS